MDCEVASRLLRAPEKDCTEEAVEKLLRHQEICPLCVGKIAKRYAVFEEGLEFLEDYYLDDSKEDELRPFYRSKEELVKMALVVIGSETSKDFLEETAERAEVCEDLLGESTASNTERSVVHPFHVRFRDDYGGLVSHSAWIAERTGVSRRFECELEIVEDRLMAELMPDLAVDESSGWERLTLTLEHPSGLSARFEFQPDLTLADVALEEPPPTEGWAAWAVLQCAEGETQLVPDLEVEREFEVPPWVPVPWERLVEREVSYGDHLGSSATRILEGKVDLGRVEGVTWFNGKLDIEIYNVGDGSSCLGLCFPESPSEHAAALMLEVEVRVDGRIYGVIRLDSALWDEKQRLPLRIGVTQERQIELRSRECVDE